MQKKKTYIRILTAILVVTVCICLGLAFTSQRIKQSEGRISEAFDRITVSADGDMKTQRGFSWFTPEDIASGSDLFIVEAHKKSFLLAKTFHAKAVKTNSGEVTHQVTVKGLKPGTTYRYRVGDAAEGEYSGSGTFTTAGEEEICMFLAVSDTQEQTKNGYEFAAESLRQGLTHGTMDFVLNAGDVVDDGSRMEQWRGFLNTASDVFMNQTFAGIGGNHVPQADLFLKHFALQNETPDINLDGVNYSFDYGSAHIVVMDTNESGTISGTVSDEQIRWLKEDIQKAADGGMVWNILCLHKGPYTVGPHALQEEIAGESGSRSKLTPILEELGISLVIQGHDHIPSCTFPLKENEISPEGVVYLEMGAAGEKTYTINQELPPEYLSKFAYYDTKERKNETYHNYAVISVEPSGIAIKMYEYAFGREEMLYETEISERINRSK